MAMSVSPFFSKITQRGSSGAFADAYARIWVRDSLPSEGQPHDLLAVGSLLIEGRFFMNGLRGGLHRLHCPGRAGLVNGGAAP